MALFDKLNSLAKNVGDKTSDAIELTKLNSRIASEKLAINELYKKIGEYYYAKHTAGAAADPEASELFFAIDGHNKAIDEAQSQIDAIKAEPVQAAPEAAAVEGGAVCAACGTSNAEGTRFCSQCGAKLEAEKPAVRVCPACGAEVADGVKFCSQCGARVD